MTGLGVNHRILRVGCHVFVMLHPASTGAAFDIISYARELPSSNVMSNICFQNNLRRKGEEVCYGSSLSEPHRLHKM